jgi:stearoyl-CoA desaturase (Delta-9 desaturase)
MVKRRPDQEAAKAAVDMSDLEADAVVMWQKKLYWLAMPVFAFLLPINAPTEYWSESLITSLAIVGALRHVVVLHAAWLVTSGPLLFGIKHGQ